MKAGIPPELQDVDVYENPAWQTSRKIALSKSGGKCVVCGTPTNTVHHVEPISRGGDHFDEGNLLPLCPKHHAKFHADLTTDKRLRK